MFNFCRSCGLFDNTPKDGDQAYEAFERVPPSQEYISKNPNKDAQDFSENIVRSKGLGAANQPNNNFSSSKFSNQTPKQSILALQDSFQDIRNNNSNLLVKKVAKSNYSELINQFQGTNNKFTDPDFSPNSSSLGDFLMNQKFDHARWKRIPQVINNPIFIEGIIQPNDIIQGNVQDCYFLSSLSAIAQKDYRIKNLFPKLEINPNGIYMARILHKGVLRQVVVDDYIPVDEKGIPLLAKPANGREIWVLILQKCWAKLSGSYSDIAYGFPHEVLPCISGAPTFYNSIDPYDEASNNNLWARTIQNQKNGAIFCAGSYNDPKKLQKTGLVPAHAYTVLQFFEVPFKMLKLRNPWGKMQWNGRLSDSDIKFWSTLTPSQKQLLKYQQKDDGVFFMLWEDFVKYFFILDTCKINDNSHFTYLESDFSSKSGQIFEIDFEGGDFTLMFFQQQNRGSETYKKNNFSRSTLVVGRQDGNNLTYVESNSSSKAIHNLQIKSMPKGKYFVYAKIDWNDKSTDSATLSIYSSNFAHLKKSSEYNNRDFLYQAFLDHSRKNRKRITIDQDPKMWMCIDLLIQKCGFGYIMVHIDPTSQTSLGVEVDENQYKKNRMVMKKPYKGLGITKASVKPGKQLIILYRIKSKQFQIPIGIPKPKLYRLF